MASEGKRAEIEAELKRLQELISTAKERNLKFLAITDTWSSEERKVFLDGVSRYHGKARTLYCETTGLTSPFIATTSIINLRIAAQNVGIEAPEVLYNTQELKRRLNQFTISVNHE